jgi:hypothetical protein
LGKGGRGQIGSVYKQPETEEDDSCHSRREPSKWKRGTRGSRATARGVSKWSKGSQQGEQGESARGARENAPCVYVTIM